MAQRSLNNYADDIQWWQQHAGLVYDSLPQRHVFRALSLGDNKVGYGTLNGLAGDHAENPLALEEGLHYGQSRLHQVIELHQRALLESRSAAADPDLVRIDDQYLPLASENPYRRTYSLKGGISANLDYWVTPKRFMGLYTYLQVGAYQEQGKQLKPLFSPAIGVQPGSLLGLRYYELPVWLRWPAQLVHSLRVRGNVQYVPRRLPMVFITTEIDLFY